MTTEEFSLMRRRLAAGEDLDLRIKLLHQLRRRVSDDEKRGAFITFQNSAEDGIRGATEGIDRYCSGIVPFEVVASAISQWINLEELRLTEELEKI